MVATVLGMQCQWLHHTAEPEPERSPQQEASWGNSTLNTYRSGEPVAVSLKVKNTFIEYFSSDDEDEDECMLPMGKMKSCPVHHANPWGNLLDLSRILGGYTSVSVRLPPIPQEPSAFGLQEDQGLGKVAWEERIQQPPAEGILIPIPTFGKREANAVACLPVVEDPAASAPEEEDTLTVAPGASPQVVPLAVRRPGDSLGSAEHGTGGCKPCAWFWRPQGCTNGADCRHCHMCSIGAVKAWRKRKLNDARGKKRQSDALTP